MLMGGRRGWCRRGTRRSTRRAPRAATAGAARRRPPVEPGGAARGPVCGRAWPQVARPTGAVRERARDLHPDEPLVEERRARPVARARAARADRAHQARGRGVGQHYREGPTGRYGAVRPDRPQPVGSDRGGRTTEIDPAAAGARTALTFAPSPGPADDAPAGRHLLHCVARRPVPPALTVDRLHAGDDPGQLALAPDSTPIVPPSRARAVARGLRPGAAPATLRGRAAVRPSAGTPMQPFPHQ